MLPSEIKILRIRVSLLSHSLSHVLTMSSLSLCNSLIRSPSLSLPPSHFLLISLSLLSPLPLYCLSLSFTLSLSSLLLYIPRLSIPLSISLYVYSSIYLDFILPLKEHTFYFHFLFPIFFLPLFFSLPLVLILSISLSLFLHHSLLLLLLLLLLSPGWV